MRGADIIRDDHIGRGSANGVVGTLRRYLYINKAEALRAEAVFGPAKYVELQRATDCSPTRRLVY